MLKTENHLSPRKVRKVALTTTQAASLFHGVAAKLASLATLVMQLTRKHVWLSKKAFKHADSVLF